MIRVMYGVPASSAGVEILPRIKRAGSDGRSCVAAKTTIETTSSVKRPSRILRITKPQTPWNSRAAKTRLVTAVAAAVIGASPSPSRLGPAGTAQAHGPGRCSSAERDRPVSVAELVQGEGALEARLEPLDLRAVAVESVVEAPDDVAAGVVFHLLHLVDDLELL